MKLVNFASSMAISHICASVLSASIEHDNRPASDLYKRCCIDLPLAAHAKYLSKHVWLNRREIVFPIHFVLSRCTARVAILLSSQLRIRRQDIHTRHLFIAWISLYFHYMFVQKTHRHPPATYAPSCRMPYVCSMRASCHRFFSASFSLSTTHRFVVDGSLCTIELIHLVILTV